VADREAVMIEAKTLHDMFWLGVPVLEKVLRPVAIYAFLILSLRLAGKRELAQLNPFDLVVLLTISNTVQNAIIGDDNSVTGGLIGAATLLLVNHVVVRYLYGHEALERLVEGDEDVLIENGEMRTDRLRKELITEGELLSAARKQGFERLSDVDRATIEPGGTIVFLARKRGSEPRNDDEVLRKLEELRAELVALRSNH
jgi:uncharacterized membrane protein YcaP (DUF421 family)